MKRTIGGDRLGAGGKQEVYLHGYGRSTHDLSYIWKSTNACGTLIPFIKEVGLPGDTFDINLDVDVMTHPTIGPLFGSYKIQLDVFSCPIRLYNAKLHMNMIGIGMKMDEVRFPQISMDADGTKIGDTDQINPSSIFAYLGIRGVGRLADVNGTTSTTINRQFNGLTWLMYWDIYKNYYANKQEGIGAYIHNEMNNYNQILEQVHNYANPWHYIPIVYTEIPQILNLNGMTLYDTWYFQFQLGNETQPDISKIGIVIGQLGSEPVPITMIWDNISVNTLFTGTPNAVVEVECAVARFPYDSALTTVYYCVYDGSVVNSNRPIIETFELENIDNMRLAILRYAGVVFGIKDTTMAPYGNALKKGLRGWSKESTQEGLALKTYQSDLYNNWLDKESIDGGNGINEITSIDVSGGTLKMETLVLQKKVYDMLNRINISGGTYDDWQDAVYTHERVKQIENPIYQGGLSRELAFQEVISNAKSGDQVLGTLAGRGKLTQKKKGGKIRVKINEPSYVIGIYSLTPRLDYSQGNKWDVDLKNMNQLHKPALDEIGFEELLTDRMAWWDTQIVTAGSHHVFYYSSAGKVPAWINYMTNVNQNYGNFAEVNEQMFMTLNRRYEKDSQGAIKDLTTYIDPSKFNYIFADTRLDAQNFWTQISVDMKVRRKMSAKIMPNL